MAESISIVMKMTEDITGNLKSIASTLKGVSKEFELLQRQSQQLGQRYEDLNKKAASTSAHALSVQKAMKEAEKAFKKTGDEADKVRFEKLREQYTQLTDAAKGYTTAAKETIKDMNGIAQTARKLGGEGEQSSFFSKLLNDDIRNNLMNSGLIREIGSSLSGFASTKIASAIGQPVATEIGETVSGTISGISAGAIAGLPGMILGGVIGAGTGYLNGKTKTFQAEDDAFKSYVQEAYDGQLAEMDAARESGSDIAGRREQDQIAFAQRFGSDKAADDYLGQVKAMAVNTNYSYDEITGYSKSLLNTYDPAKTLDVLMKLSDATAGLNLDSSGVSMFINGLARMRTTGKATQEYLNYFSERGLDVYQALSDSTGADKSKIAGMVTDGEIGGAEAAEAILTYIQEQFGGLSEKLAGTYDAMVDNLGDAEANLNARMGEGYNEERKAGIEAQTAWIDSEGLGDAYEAIGAWKASLENAKEQYIREAVNDAMGTDEYQQAEAAGDAAEMGRIIMAAKVQGMNEYNSSEGAQLALESERTLAESIRNDAAGNQDYWDAGFEKGNWFTKGLAAGMQKDIIPIGLGSTVSPEQMGDGDPQDWNRHAYGLKRVPFDGYPALLHQDERVLTAAEAREQGSGGLQVTFSGPITVRQDSDLDEIARRLADKLEQARMRAG